MSRMFSSASPVIGSSSLLSQKIRTRPFTLVQTPLTIKLSVPSALLFTSEVQRHAFDDLNNLSREALFGLNRFILRSDGNIEVSGALYNVRFRESTEHEVKRGIHNIAYVHLNSMDMIFTLLDPRREIPVASKRAKIDLGLPERYQQRKDLSFKISLPWDRRFPAKLSAQFRFVVRTSEQNDLSLFESPQMEIRNPRI